MIRSRLFNVRRQTVHGVDLMVADFRDGDELGSVSVEVAVYEAHGDAALEEQVEGALAEVEARRRRAMAIPAVRHSELR